MGHNGYGQLGNANTSNKTSPIQIFSNGVIQVAAGYDHTYVLKSDGSLWTMGRNQYGQLGNNSTTNQTTPTLLLDGNVTRLANVFSDLNFSSPPIITQGNSAITKVLDEDTPVIWVPSELNATDADTNASSLAWSLVTAPSHGTAVVYGNGSYPSILSYQPNANFYGSDSFSVQVSDGENSDSITINLTVNSVNDNPTIYSINGQTLPNSLTAEILVPENSSVSLGINASDSIEGDTITFQKTGGTDQSIFDLNSSTGMLSLSSALDFENPIDSDGNNTYEVWLRAIDGEGGYSNKRIMIKVTNIIEDHDGDGIEDAYDTDDDNDGFSDTIELAYGSNPLDANSTANKAPSEINADSNLTIIENSKIGTIVGKFSASDPDSNTTSPIP